MLRGIWYLKSLVPGIEGRFCSLIAALWWFGDGHLTVWQGFFWSSSPFLHLFQCHHDREVDKVKIESSNHGRRSRPRLLFRGWAQFKSSKGGRKGQSKKVAVKLFTIWRRQSDNEIYLTWGFVWMHHAWSRRSSWVVSHELKYRTMSIINEYYYPITSSCNPLSTPMSRSIDANPGSRDRNICPDALLSIL